MSMCSLFLCCWKRMFAMTSAFSWQNSFSLCPASFCTPRPNLPVTPGIFWIPILHSRTLWWKGIFFGISSRGLAEKAMAPPSPTWRLPWTEEPSRLQSMGSLSVGHDWATSLSLFTFLHWIWKWKPTPVFLPGESQGRGSLVGCSLWGRTELATTEAT